ncbi:MAG: YggS family pyridoxal phosphate-dependent enzyme, partial [Thermodesulfobacteriota bacterium]|nr:YggS family pyridoxal phosphate-dependent enzyme [Thermodesulfobacteriota bacterium]
GENYVQEAKQKIEKFGQQVQWHMIGHLQTNKVKSAVNLFHMIQAVDRIEVAREINKRGVNLGKKISVLIQVNISQEDSKSGVEKERVVSLVSEIADLTHIQVKGLMTMPPFFADPEEARPYFKSLRKLRDEIERERFQDTSMRELSMGMSNDFEVAIQEGATLVRVGTAIFGERR